jgi:hypothetical protein
MLANDDIGLRNAARSGGIVSIALIVFSFQ